MRVLHHAAQTSVGVGPGATSVSMQISLLVGRLRLIGEQADQMVERLMMPVDAAEESKYLLSTRGTNYLSVAGLLAELGRFRSYQNAKQIFSGLVELTEVCAPWDIAYDINSCPSSCGC